MKLPHATGKSADAKQKPLRGQLPSLRGIADGVCQIALLDA
jgi:hypothetical protein